jgi:biotin synthase-related radical SAM superfamily protein
VDWLELKARLLETGTARLTGAGTGPYISASTAGPGAGSGGSIFFSTGSGRVRLTIDPGSPVGIEHRGGGMAVLRYDGMTLGGVLEPVALHCPRQAYITVTSGCVYRCRYCEVPAVAAGRKTPDQIEEMVAAVAARIDAISVTSGVLASVEEEEEYVISIVGRLLRFGIPIGVSIFPGEATAERLYDLGVTEVKFNVETATRDLFAVMCPALDWDMVWRALRRSVDLFGRGHVFSNLIIGLGEQDGEVEDCLRALIGIGVIPVIRPLNPAGELRSYARPTAERLLRIYGITSRLLQEAALDPRDTLTMCPACTGCDLVPGRDGPL